MKSIAAILLLVALSSASALQAPLVTKSANPIIKVAASGMSLLKPIFGAEAKLQAAILGGSVDEDDVIAEIEAEAQANKILIYTYALSPFSTEAVAILESSGYDFEKIELGAEWFLLGPKNSVKRVALSKYAESGATSLPKVFIGGKCIGGCAELSSAVESGEFDELVKKAFSPAPKKGMFAKIF
jgi:glutaredoxin-related protein